MGWDVDDCTEKFCRFAVDTLGGPGSVRSSRLRRVRGLARALLTGGIYDASTVASALQEYLGDDLRLFGPSVDGPSGPKLVITATTLHGTSAVTFDNYNPVGDVQRSLAYSRIERQSPGDEPTVWEV